MKCLAKRIGKIEAMIKAINRFSGLEKMEVMEGWEIVVRETHENLSA